MKRFLFKAVIEKAVLFSLHVEGVNITRKESRKQKEKKRKKAGGVRVRFSETGGDAVAAGAAPSSGLGRKAEASTACCIYSRQTINQHQAINLAFEPSLKPIKAHSCQMEFILISFQSQ